MELVARAHIVVACPPDGVFDLATGGLEKYIGASAPIPGVVSVAVDGGAPLGKGVRRAVTLSDGSVTREEITEFERPRRYAYRWLNPPPAPVSFIVRTAHADFRFMDGGGSTTVDWSYTLVLTSVLAFLPGTVIRLLFRRWMQGALDELSSLLHPAGHSTASSP